MTVENKAIEETGRMRSHAGEEASLEGVSPLVFKDPGKFMVKGSIVKEAHVARSLCPQ